MMTMIGAQKIAARRIGVPWRVYTAKIEAGYKWCSYTKHWELSSEFPPDSSRGDGLCTSCKKCKRAFDGLATTVAERKRGGNRNIGAIL